MKIVYIDIDTLRPDHLGCYGYHRNTSPNMDAIARESVRFSNCFVPDAPCLPSRAALHHGKFGIHNGALNHGGTYADPCPEGPTRSFQNTPGYKKFTQILQSKGYYTALVSSFAGRHDSWWFLAGFNEVYDCGRRGHEIQGEVTSRALQMLDSLKGKENWYLHFNIWDPHTPYRTPAEYGNPFAKDPPPAWMTQELIDEHQKTFGLHCAANRLRVNGKFTPREPTEIKTLADYRKHVDGYDVGIRYADDAVGTVVAKLKEMGIYEETVIMISSDHGENQGELNVYGDHQTADLITNRVPMILKWPGVKPRVDGELYYQFDVAATILQLIGAEVPAKWDARGFKTALLEAQAAGRDYLVVSNAAWSAQRAVIFGDHILIKTYRDPFRDYPELMLFNWKNDPHELVNLAGHRPDLVNEGLARLQEWVDEQMMKSDSKQDPFMLSIAEGGPLHVRGELENMIAYYEEAGRPEIVERIKDRYRGVFGVSTKDYLVR